MADFMTGDATMDLRLECVRIAAEIIRVTPPQSGSVCTLAREIEDYVKGTTDNGTATETPPA